MKNCIFAIALVGSICFTTGCLNGAAWRNSAAEKEINTEEAGSARATTGGKFQIKSLTFAKEETELSKLLAQQQGKDMSARAKSMLHWLQNKSDYTRMFVDDGKDTVVPVSITITESLKSNTGGLAMCNDVLSILTLTVWPMVSGTETSYKIEVSYPTFTRTRTVVLDRRDMFSIFPLGLIPVPGWADKDGRGWMSDDWYEKFADAQLNAVILKLLSRVDYNAAVKAMEEASQADAK